MSNTSNTKKGNQKSTPKKSSTTKKKTSSSKAKPKQVKKVIAEEKKEMDQSFLEEKKEPIPLEVPTTKKKRKHLLVRFFLIILLVLSLFSFVITMMDKSSSLFTLLTGLLLTLFTILFVGVGFSYGRRNHFVIFLSGIVLIAYFLLGINNKYSFISNPISSIEDFSGKDLTYVMKWASKNKITVHQEYEYSDMIDEYKVISQDKTMGTDLKDVKEITVSVSEGPNPSKEVIVPSMITWSTDRVIQFVEDNYLSNVIVEFVESDKEKDTVIEQSSSGTLSRDDELKLTFSYGEELGFEEVTLIDFKKKSKFAVEFYMKQHQLKYEFTDDFSSSIKKGFATKQSIKPGEVVKINDEVIKVTISKGPKIKVPELKKYSLTELTEWAIKNKLKLNFLDQYDDSIKENGIISVSAKKGDILEQGAVLEVMISRGSLKMPKFKNIEAFYEWANKYNIDYEEVHEFSDTIAQGEVISYSYKAGETIKNKDTIIVKISDGAKKEVPNLKGLTKSEAISKLEKAGLHYNFVYKNSSEKKDKVLSQSISAGSEVSKGSTITVTLSNGKGDEEETPKSQEKQSRKIDDNNNNPTPPREEDVQPPVEPTCNSCTIRASMISSAINGAQTCREAASRIKSNLQNACNGLTVNVTCKKADGYDNLDIISGFTGGTTDSCSTVSLVIAEQN